VAVFIEPQYGQRIPLGVVFVSYCRVDRQSVKNVIEQCFIGHGVPYFLDELDIFPGDAALTKIENALAQASCGVIVLSPKSIRSQWLWFETGVLVGKDTPIIPFLLRPPDNPKTFIRDLPDFIRRYQITDDVYELVDSVRKHVFEFGHLYKEQELNRRVFPILRQAMVTLTLHIDQRIVESMSFGYLLVRFGREDVVEHPMNYLLLDEAQILNHPVSARSTEYDQKKNVLKIDYVIPVHPKLGAKYKPFVDVSDLKNIKQVIEILQENDFQDVKQSGSAERQRIYFLLPLEGRHVVQSPDGILDNYLYPL